MADLAGSVPIESAATVPAKTLESWIWKAACSIRGAKDAAKYKEFILPLVFAKRLCDVFDDEIDRIAAQVGSREKAFALVERQPKLVRFYLPLRPTDPTQPVWSVIRTLSTDIGQELTTHLRSIAKAEPRLEGVVDRVDFNATTHGQRDLDDDRLSNLIEAISSKRLGLDDVEADIIGRTYEYLIRKFAEGSGQSAGEFYTPAEVGMVMARVMNPAPGMDVYDPCCGSAGLLIKCQLVADQSASSESEPPATIRLYGQEGEAGTWAMANMNMIIHDMEGEIEIGDTFRKPKFRVRNRLQTFDRVVANPMWNQPDFNTKDYENDEWGRFPKGAGFPGGNADWGWLQHILASLKPQGQAAVVLDTGAASRGSGSKKSEKERTVRRWFLQQDLIEAVAYLPENLFYNTPAAGIIVFLNKQKVADRANKVLMLNAQNDFISGRNKNYLSVDAIDRMVDTITGWSEIEHYSRIVEHSEILAPANDSNVEPSRYVQPDTTRSHRPLSIMAKELQNLDQEVADANRLVEDMLDTLLQGRDHA